MKYIDDHEENSIDTLGSWICTSVTADHTYGSLQIREYMGLSSDVDKLPHYKDLATGSLAICIDTGDSYFYDAVNKTWIMQ